jgi:hypothetical protein
LKLNNFFGGISHINIFNFAEGEEYCKLLFGNPGNGDKI